MKFTRPCRYCKGTGKELDQFRTGQQLRTLREKAGISLRDMAKLLDISAPFLSDLELGRRDWSEKRIDQFMEAVRKKSTSKG